MRGLSFFSRLLLAPWTNPKEFKPMGHLLKPIDGSDSFFDFIRKAFIHFNHLRALHADQVMAVAIVPFLQQSKPRTPIAKVEAFDHSLVFEHVHRAIDRGQIANPLTQGEENLPYAQRMRLAPENRQDGLARPGQLLGPATQSFRQSGQLGSMPGVMDGLVPHV